MFGALTSAGIQRRYLRGCEKRDGIEMIAEYWLLDEEDKNDVPPSILNKLTFFTVSGGKNGINSPGNPVNSPGNPQSKVKESKGKKSKEYNEAAPADAGDGQKCLIWLLFLYHCGAIFHGCKRKPVPLNLFDFVYCMYCVAVLLWTS